MRQGPQAHGSEAASLQHVTCTHECWALDWLLGSALSTQRLQRPRVTVGEAESSKETHASWEPCTPSPVCRLAQTPQQRGMRPPVFTLRVKHATCLVDPATAWGGGLQTVAVHLPAGVQPAWRWDEQVEGRLKCGKAECPRVYPASFWKQILLEADPETRTQCSLPRKAQQQGQAQAEGGQAGCKGHRGALGGGHRPPRCVCSGGSWDI